MRLIDADALVKELSDKYIVPVDEAASGVAAFMGIQTRQAINNAPTIEAEPIKHGRWIYIRDEENNGLYECSECHKGDIHAKECEVSYCWNCGARMDGGENEK